MQIKQESIYIADDGMKFLTKESCEEHEKKNKRIKYFVCACSPDLTEGRGWNKTLYIAVNPRTDWEDAYLYCIEYLIRRFQTIMSYVQGCSLIANFTLPKEITKKEYSEAMSKRIGDYPTDVEKIFLSKIDVKGFPTPIDTVFLKDEK